MRYGIPPSGAMDQYSYRIGNLLVGNPENLASLEITLQGLKIEATASVTIAITGGDLNPCLNDYSAPQWAPLEMKKGDILHFRWRETGFRAYLAVKGGIDVPVVLGSRSTFLRGKIGTPLKEGAILCAGEVEDRKPIKWLGLSSEYIPDYRRRDPIRILVGPQNEYFTTEGFKTFLTCPYKITSQSDRMAYRMEGPPIEVTKGPGIISEPIARGAIQVPADGQPIILLRDAQVTGGYAKIATVVAADMDPLGQMPPGEFIRFEQIEREEALHLLLESRTRLSMARG